MRDLQKEMRRIRIDFWEESYAPHFDQSTSRKAD
jgi:hypothetical protein